MKRPLLAGIFAFIVSIGFAQNLVTSRTGSHYTAIYQLTPLEARELLEKGDKTLKNSYFHTVVDYFPTDSIYRKTLPPGHYLYVKSLADELRCELESVNNLEMEILNNHRDLQLVFLDKKGNEVRSLKPKVKNRTVPFDKPLNVYRIGTTNKQGLVTVEHEGHVNFFSMRRQYNNTFAARARRRIFYTFPLKHVLAPVRYVYRSTKSLIQWGRIDPPPVYYKVRDYFENDRTFDGFMVLNKPKYKPGDTVKLKAYVTNKKGKLFTKDLDVMLNSWSYGRFNRKLTTLKPYRPGCYGFEFALTDTLKLSLDQQYTVELNDKHFNNFPSARFHFEQYELKQNNFAIRAADTEFTRNKPKVIFLKGTDINDMPLYDIRVELLVTTKSFQQSYDKLLFVPDTLWRHSLKLDPLGETRITLPDSIFLNAALEVEIGATFRNAENEVHSKSVKIKYDALLPEYTATLERDSIKFSSAVVDKNHTLVLLSKQGDELDTKTIVLPYQEKINQNVHAYELLDEKRRVSAISLQQKGDLLEVMAQRTQDSLRIQIQNLRQLNFRYQLFKGNQIIERGIGKSYTHKRHTKPNERYYISIQYVWAGNAQEKNYDLPFAKKALTVAINHPTIVYPGQTAEFNILVNDAFGKPVANADITAMAITKKFKTDLRVDLLSYEKFKNRKAFNVFYPNTLREVTLQQKLQYDFWKPRLGLDSISYYKFLYPVGGKFEFSFPVDDSITQVAPYVVKDGTIQTVHYIYINSPHRTLRRVAGKISYNEVQYTEELKYFNQVGNPEPYSFAVTADSFDIVLRLTHKLITLKNVKISKGRKLILSIDADHLPPGAFSMEKESKMSAEENRKLQPHFLWVQRYATQKNAYFKAGTKFSMLDVGNLRGPLMVGPFFPGYLEYHTTTFNHTFDFRPNRVYQFTENLIDRDYVTWSTPRFLYSKYEKPVFRDRVLTKTQIEKKFREFENTKTYESKKSSEYYYATQGNGSLSLTHAYRGIKPKAVFFLNLNKPDEYFIYPGGLRSFKKLEEGPYQVVIIFSDESYLRPAPVRVQQNGNTYYNIESDSIHPPDSFSKEVMDKIFKWSTQNSYAPQIRDKEMQKVREEFYHQATPQTLVSGGHWISGKITSAEDGSGLPGVNVVVKGTTIGTVTDAEGYYRLYAPFDAVLVFSFIGLKSEEVESQPTMDVQLQSDVTQLSEVVVTAYGVSTERKALGFSVSTVSKSLSGRVAGVQINGRTVMIDSVNIMIRGAATLGAPGSSPLIVVDGVIMSMDDIDPSIISRIEILKSDQAVALYGSRASNGVMLISTKSGITRDELLKTKLLEAAMTIPDVALEGSALRKNFRDYAFWKPRLRTDGNGQISFKTTFPDDITAWNVSVIAIAEKKRTAQQQSAVRSFKPLLAQLAMPNFLIEGDNALAIGKITNYSSDSVSLVRKISLRDKMIGESSLKILNSKIDSIALLGTGDSLIVKYEITHKGYQDGELRKIPVLPKGTKEAKGIFVAISGDSTFQIQLQDSKGKITVRAEADALDVLLDEIRQLHVYPYDCNEQLASKLRAMLAQRTILEFRKEKTNNDYQIEKAIRKLVSHQNKDGGWGWWENGTSSLWISRYVATALNWAQTLGFKVRYDETGLKNYLTPVLSTSNTSSQRGWFTGSGDEILKSLIFISEQGEKVEARSIVDSLTKQKKLYTTYDSLLANRLLQLNGTVPDWNWINKQRHETLRGNWYWGREGYTLWNNDIDNTLIVYQMLEHANPHDPTLQKLRSFFIERRKSVGAIHTSLPAS